MLAATLETYRCVFQQLADTNQLKLMCVCATSLSKLGHSTTIWPPSVTRRQNVGQFFFKFFYECSGKVSYV